jgi:hypothetical protein
MQCVLLPGIHKDIFFKSCVPIKLVYKQFSLFFFVYAVDDHCKILTLCVGGKSSG